MLLEELQAFLQEIREDSSLQEKLMDPTADPVAISNSLRFHLTHEELVKVVRKRIVGSRKQLELIDRELEHVSGACMIDLYTGLVLIECSLL